MPTRRELLKWGAFYGGGSLLVNQVGGIESAEAAPTSCHSLVINNGIRIADFSGTKWTPLWSNPVLESDYNMTIGIKSRTGARSMLRWGPVAEGFEAIHLSYLDLPEQAPLILNGRFGLWIYCDAQPGFAPGEQADSILHVVMTTDPAGNFSHAIDIGFNANQIREGWNFLKFVDNPVGHPLGVYKSFWGNGSAGDIVNNPVYSILLYTEQQDIGITWYLDSLWTGFESVPQVVLGCDAFGTDLRDYCLPVFENYGWLGYVAAAYRVWTSGPTVVSEWGDEQAVITAMGDAGWDIVNHTVNHLRMGDITDASDIQYEIQAQDTWLRSLMVPTQGLKFFASPQGSTSRLSEATLEKAWIVAQRHFRKWNTSITQFGIDNPHHIGSLGLEDVAYAQTFNKIKKQIDIAVEYEDTLHLFWHELVTSGDPGDGSGNTGSYSTMYRSSWDIAINYIRNLELAGELRVAKGFSGFFNHY